MTIQQRSKKPSLMIISELADELKSLSNLSEEQKALRIMLSDLTDQIRELKQTPPSDPFTFELEVDDYEYADDSWERIIELGQTLQAEYRDKAETYWINQNNGAKSPWGVGGYGSFEAPKIVINCVEPVYRFRNTARLPGSFQVTSPAHMGSILRFVATGNRVLNDNNGWWHQTYAPIGLYIEPQTEVDGRQIHNFEQSISNLTIVGQNGSMPIYIADNAFNLRIKDCNIQSHQGSSIVIKHGPAISSPSWYPCTQKPSGNNYLPDPIFSNCLIEGQHKFDRRNAGLCVSGNNIQFHGLNFYGVLTGIMSTGQGRTVTATTMHHGGTHDGRSWCDKDQLALGFLSRRHDSNLDSLPIQTAFPLLNPLKGSRALETRGWYQVGDATI